MEAPQQPQASSALKDELAKVTDKMMGLKLSQLKKRAKKNGIPDEAIEEAAAGAGDEEDAKCVLISLILKAACVKAAPSPTRARSGGKTMFHAHTCSICPGCIRPPGHEGPCMDGQCNEIFPEPTEEKRDVDVSAEVARHKVVKEEVTRKVQEQAAEKAMQKAAAEQAVMKRVAARQKAAEEEASRQKAAKEEAARKAAEAEAARQKAAEEEAVREAAEEEAARQKAAEEEAARKAAEEDAFRQKVAEEEAARRAAEEEAIRATEAAAMEKLMKDRRALQQATEEAEMAEMDVRCMDTFIKCTTCSWRDRVRTPVKGTMLYTKFMRPCRPAGTSVDVKDSSFHNLLNFLQFLEGEGLLCLKPGLTDPVVTDIDYEACCNYTYVPRGSLAAPVPSTPVKEEQKPVVKLSAPISGHTLSPVSSWIGGCAKRFQ